MRSALPMAMGTMKSALVETQEASRRHATLVKIMGEAQDVQNSVIKNVR